MTIWYLEIEGAQNGPFSHEDVVKKIVDGSLTRKSLIWKSGTEKWMQLDQVSEFSDQLNEHMPPVITPPPLPTIHKVPSGYAWRRFFAKLIDVTFASVLALILALVLPIDGVKGLMIFVFLATASIWLMFECALNLKTLGRVMLGIHVNKIDENASLVQRSIVVATVGMGLEVPLVSLITKVIAYISYRKTGTTYWDRDKFVVEFKACSLGSYVATAFVLLVLLTSQSFLGKFNGRIIADQQLESFIDYGIKSDSYSPSSISQPALSPQISANEAPRLQPVPSNLRASGPASEPTPEPTKLQSINVTEWNPASTSYDPQPYKAIKLKIYGAPTIEERNGQLISSNKSYDIYFRRINFPFTPRGGKFSSIDSIDKFFSYMSKWDGELKEKVVGQWSLASAARVKGDQPQGRVNETSYYFGDETGAYVVSVSSRQNISASDRQTGCKQLDAVLTALGGPKVRSWPKVGFTNGCN